MGEKTKELDQCEHDDCTDTVSWSQMQLMNFTTSVSSPLPPPQHPRSPSGSPVNNSLLWYPSHRIHQPIAPNSHCCPSSCTTKRLISIPSSSLLSQSPCRPATEHGIPRSLDPPTAPYKQQPRRCFPAAKNRTHEKKKKKIRL